MYKIKLFTSMFVLFFCLNNYINANDLQKTSIQFSWLHQFEYAGYYAAKEKGFYKEAGLDVQFKEMDFSKKDSVIQDVLTGKSTYAIDYSSIVRSYMNGQPIVFVANFFKHSPLVLVTQKDIEMPSDLKGKKFMGGNDALNNTAMLLMLKQFNIKKDDFINIPQTFKIDEFINKEVDATTIFLTNQAYTLNKMAYEYNILNPEKYGAEFYVDNLFTSKSEVLNNPLRVKAFKQATIKGWEYALNNKEEIVNLILEKYNTQKKSKEELLFEARQTENLMLPSVYPIGSIDINRVIRIANTYKQLGILDNGKKMNINEFVFDAKSKNIYFSKEQKEYLKNKKVIKLCIDPNWMPFEEIDEKGNHAGISSEYFKLFQKELPIPIELVKTYTWKDSLDAIKNKKCDILSLAATTKERTKYLDFTKAYLSSSLVLVTKSGVPFFDDIRSLRDKRIAIVKDYAHLETIKEKYPFLDIYEVSTQKEGLAKVLSSDAFGLIASLETAVYKLQKQNVGELKISAKFDEKQNFSIATRNDEPLLNEIFNSLISSLDEFNKQKIYNKYVSINFESRSDYTLLITFIFIFAIILFIIVSWNRKLKNEKLKTEKALNELRIAEKQLEQKNQKLEQLSVTDTLTKIFNREKLDRELLKELYRSERTGDVFSLIMLDIDYFKDVNDIYGHQVGDNVLVEFTQIIKTHIRKIDTFGRWGGEEFMIICPHTNSLGATKKAEKIRKLIESHKFNTIGNKTASFGVATYKKDDDEKSIVYRVDKAMYKAKNNGRNQVSFYN